MNILKFVIITLAGGLFGGLLGYYGKCASGACPLTANPYRGAAFGLLIGAIAAVGFACSPRAPHSEGPDLTIKIKDRQDFADRVLASSDLVIVDFYADWCPPCRKLAPVLHEIAGEGADHGLKVAKVNVDHNRELATEYKVSGIPHLALIRSGKVVDTKVGYVGKSELQAWLQNAQTKSP